MTTPISVSKLKRLQDAAIEASTKAYAKYSKFKVGAAVLTDSGKVFSGCNVENASYGLAICAERNAIFAAVRAGERKIKAVVIYTPTKKATAPCGACRQVIREFGKHARIISCCNGSDTIDTSLSELLPRSFGPEDLK